jgi:RNA polymerase sigma factor (sigma-70 family)
MSPDINSVRAYLYVILKNNILNYYRKEVSRKRYQEYAAQLPQFDYSTQVTVESRELEKQLSNEIEKLPPKCRAVFKLSRHEHLSNKEIAARLGISENTVEQHMRKALRDLRSAFGGLMEAGIIIYLTGY